MLFDPIQIGNIQIKNRLVRSATYESMATPTGEYTDELGNLYAKLSKGDVGLIITGHMYVHSSGKGGPLQLGIHEDNMIPGLKKLTNLVKQFDSKIIFQLSHAGIQTTITKPVVPSKKVRHPILFRKPRMMMEDEIIETIQSFVDASKRSIEAGADGIQLLASHGYLINEFLSPFFNDRNDDWGGSAENRFLFLKKIIKGIKQNLPADKILIVKLNANDYLPSESIDPILSATYAKWLVELGVDAIEISCGSTMFSPFTCARGDVPMKDLMSILPLWQKPLAWFFLRRMVGKYDLDQEGFNLEAIQTIRPKTGNTPLIAVGGFRSLSVMEEALTSGSVDMISLSRPLIREPNLIKKFQEGKSTKANCESCNRCFVGIANQLPLRCYCKHRSSLK